ncbi:MAG TPA: ABC transporter substrate-binding protein [Desulfomonilia bacterium]|jgi:putative ABC transport system substrate-binding protein|nr:ABC transporter substrate-binding protein [Deltaproteobacteria bacterium]HRR19967.1 ABC transporter substrate-binding protein [Desulfomonilia bacterium]HOS26714.1 ABC transporter substrate-binding protein [Deltaproteobacteria bacterium]HPL87533.1 ABC transporter substrate-binding protein [Deltaproteobacteria bacterium]HRR67777.1 ABC transporter substrate-binding protein [Desulfomonilia bacterium]
MRRLFIGLMSFLVVFLMTDAGFAQQKTFTIEVLQVTKIEPFDNAYQGFMQELSAAGLVEGQNLKVNRRIIDFDVEKGGLWKKVGVLFEIKSTASKIVEARPDLVLTVGTPATKYAKDKIVAAGIPLVFTAVAIPEAAGCKSLTVAGPGFTGATLYLDMADALKIARLAFPEIKTVAIVHTDDDNAMAQVEQVKAVGSQAGFTFITKEISKNDKFTPAARELIAQGAQAFAVPLDTYYGLRNYEPCFELSDVSLKNKVPVLSLVHMKVPGAILYIGAEFPLIGALSGKQAAKILLEGAKPGDLPILRQEDLTIMVDSDRLKALQIELPMEILQLAKDVE